MTKNQQIRGSFIPGPPFYKWRRDKHLSKLLHLLQFTLHVVMHFVQYLNALFCTPITLVQVL